MSGSDLIIYQSEDGRTVIETRVENETVWLTIEQMAELFQKSRSTVNEHILNIYDEGELDASLSMRKIGISDFSTKPTNFYNLDAIISVGYRVVTAYLEFAELRALNRKPMYMSDWIDRLDDFLKMTGSQILDHAGTISHEKAIERAAAEYEKYRESNKNNLSRVETHFIDHIENKAKQLSTKKRSRKNA